MNLKFIGILLVFFFSALFTWLARIYAIKKAILDVPNERSSHQFPTPRGGGIAIVLTFLGSIAWLGYVGSIELNLVFALIGGGIVIAVIGYCDDIYSVKAKWRFLIHFLAAIWALYWLHGFPILDLGVLKISLNWIGSLLAIIGIVWCINFYNFMDGIDGLAGTEGIFVALTSSIVLWWMGIDQLAIIMLLLTAAITGFIIWNWPPAKIFLGDIGSGFLGFVFATFGLYTINKGFLSITFWLAILAVFLCDATFTLLYRIYQGKQWYAAHREHAYQQLISYGAKHKLVTTSVFLINFFFLLPIGIVSIFWPTESLWLIGSIIMILWIVWARIKLWSLKN